MGGIGPFEIVIIAVVLLLFFGAKKLPELARGIGKSLKEFKKATSGIQEEIDNATNYSTNYINPHNNSYNDSNRNKDSNFENSNQDKD